MALEIIQGLEQQLEDSKEKVRWLELSSKLMKKQLVHYRIFFKFLQMPKFLSDCTNETSVNCATQRFTLLRKSFFSILMKSIEYLKF